MLLGKVILELDNCVSFTGRITSETAEVWVVRNEDVEKSMQSDDALSYKFYSYFTSLMVKWTVERRSKSNIRSNPLPKRSTKLLSDGTMTASSSISETPLILSDVISYSYHTDFVSLYPVRQEADIPPVGDITVLETGIFRDLVRRENIFHLPPLLPLEVEAQIDKQ